VLNPRLKENQTVHLTELGPNEHALSICLLSFAGKEETYLCVATVKDMRVTPIPAMSDAFIYTFTIDAEERLELVHKTQVEEVPQVIVGWKGKLLAGVGKRLRAYELGQKKLLRKAEVKDLNSPVNRIQVMEDRIYVSMVSDSIHIFKYRAKEQTFYEVADDILPRWITNFQVLDYNTIVGTDKFENCFVCRIPPSTLRLLTNLRRRTRLR